MVCAGPVVMRGGCSLGGGGSKTLSQRAADVDQPNCQFVLGEIVVFARWETNEQAQLHCRKDKKLLQKSG